MILVYNNTYYIALLYPYIPLYLLPCFLHVINWIPSWLITDIYYVSISRKGHLLFLPFPFRKKLRKKRWRCVFGWIVMLNEALSWIIRWVFLHSANPITMGSKLSSIRAGFQDFLTFLTHLNLKHMQAFSDWLWRGFLILMQCDLFSNTLFLN